MSDATADIGAGDGPIQEVDILLVGAAGFVGRLTAEYLARAAPAGTRVALTGRDPDRLAAVRDSLPSPGRDWPIVTLDLTDTAQVERVVAASRVVVSTAGPYLRLGLPLVVACASAGVHYADLTGEVLFVYRSIEQADRLARASGARIVHSCGFDSVPSDLGMWLTATTAAKAGDGPIASARLHVRAARGGLSGGTIDSMRQVMIEAAGSAGARRILSDPHALTDSPGHRASDSAAPLDPGAWRLPGGLRRGGRSGIWAAPFPMAGVNTAIVQRSNALLAERGDGYGDGLRYHEVMDTGRGLRGALRAGGIAAGLGVTAAGLAFPPTRALLDRVLPRPGEGPSETSMDAGLFRMRIEARTSTGARYRTDVGADLDPGYRGTAVMLGQSALALAAGEGTTHGGVQTPAAAIGPALVDRLLAEDFTFSCTRAAPAEDDPEPGTDG